MKLIRQEDAYYGSNSNECNYLEYSFDDKDIDFSVAEITGRYPEDGYCVNLKSKEVVYILSGEGVLHCNEKKIIVKENDAFLIDKNEKYYWDTKYLKVAMICTPAWTVEQHKVVK